MIQWVLFVLLSLAAIAVVTWRLIFAPKPQPVSDSDDLDVNRALFREKIAQLDAQLASGDISATQRHELELEFQRQFLADNPLHEASRDISSGGRKLIWISALLVPLLAVGLYQQLGASDAMKLRQLLEERSTLFMAGQGNSSEMSMITYEVVETLKRLAQRHPEDPTYPLLMARLYTDSQAFDLAAAQYGKVVALLPEDGDLLAEYAQVLFFAANNEMTPKARKLAELALTLSPHNQTALGLAGIASFNDGQYARAVEYWTRAIRMLPEQSPSRAALVSGIAAAREKLGVGGETVAEDNPVALALNVSVDPGISVAADTTVFIYARAWQGPPMPLAIKRLTVADLPVSLVLDETMAMSPNMTLASFEEVEVVARISLSGGPSASSGDYEATLGPLDPIAQSEPVALVIDRQLP